MGKNTIPSSHPRFNSSMVEIFFLLTVRDFPLRTLIEVVNTIHFTRLWKKGGKYSKGGNYLMKENNLRKYSTVRPHFTLSLCPGKT